MKKIVKQLFLFIWLIMTLFHCKKVIKFIIKFGIFSFGNIRIDYWDVNISPFGGSPHQCKKNEGNDSTRPAKGLYERGEKTLMHHMNSYSS